MNQLRVTKSPYRSLRRIRLATGTELDRMELPSQDRNSVETLTAHPGKGSIDAVVPRDRQRAGTHTVLDAHCL